MVVILQRARVSFTQIREQQTRSDYSACLFVLWRRGSAFGRQHDLSFDSEGVVCLIMMLAFFFKLGTE